MQSQIEMLEKGEHVMSGPFPGMDPFLEAPGQWESVHHAFIVYASAAINALLPDNYIAKVEEWLSIASTRKRVRPDISVRQTPALPPVQGGVAVVERSRTVPDAPRIVEIYEEETTQLYINILRVSDQSEVVTVIELLSHANKTPGKDRDAYRRKQRAIYQSATHLIEIDLLRAGAHTVAMPLERRGDSDKTDYRVCLHRGHSGSRFELWEATVRDCLPCIEVPLEEGVSDVPLDLQAVMNRVYEEGAYSRVIDYRQEPEPPLSPEDAVWADSLLREKGLR
jgi:hypothetical protein